MPNQKSYKFDQNIIVQVLDTKEEIAQKALEILIPEIQKNSEIVLGGSTGNSPKEFYKQLREKIEKGESDLSKATIIFLDEYFGRLNYHHYTHAELYYKISEDARNRTFKKQNIITPKSCFYLENMLIDSEKLEKILNENKNDWEFRDPEIYIKETAKNPVLKEVRDVCEKYEDLIDKGIAWQILGIGVEGHIGFNEKGTKEDSLTHLTKLAASTLNSNKDDFQDGFLSTYSITQGINSLSKAKNRILFAMGKNKQTAIHNTLYGEISPSNPAAYLRKMPGTTYIFLDKECAKALKSKNLK